MPDWLRVRLLGTFEMAFQLPTWKGLSPWILLDVLDAYEDYYLAYVRSELGVRAEEASRELWKRKRSILVELLQDERIVGRENVLYRDMLMYQEILRHLVRKQPMLWQEFLQNIKEGGNRRLHQELSIHIKLER